MAQVISVDEIVAFSKKLEAWSSTLNDKERTLLQRIVENKSGGELSDAQLGQASGGAIGAIQPLTFQKLAPQLDSRFFQIRCW
jgi:hypothetical protein